MITLTTEECKAIHEMIVFLSDNNPETVFLWDGTDDPKEPITSAFVKIYREIGADVPI